MVLGELGYLAARPRLARARRAGQQDPVYPRAVASVLPGGQPVPQAPGIRLILQPRVNKIQRAARQVLPGALGLVTLLAMAAGDPVKVGGRWPAPVILIDDDETGLVYDGSALLGYR